MSAPTANEPPSAQDLRAAFERAAPYTVGLEEEVMLLDPETLELVPRARDVLAAAGADGRFKLELPASQVEIVTAPHRTVPDAAAELAAGRRDLAARTAGLVRLAAAGVHPFSPGMGELNRIERYEQIIREYGPIASRQLVCAFQVHVSVPGADRALAVYNHARSYLPLLAALAANGAFFEGADTGLASMRPKIGELLPRQGVPPIIGSWEEQASALAWGSASDSVHRPRTWWWELRPHPRFGTLEFRVPDAQATVADGAAIAAVVQALAVWLGERHDAGERLEPAPTWRIEENRWSACRHGVEGEMTDLVSGAPRPTREWLRDLVATLRPVAQRLGAVDELDRSGRLIEVNGAIAQRLAGADAGAQGVARSLADRFLEPLHG